MKYELLKTDLSIERPVMEDGLETDEYEITITLFIQPTDLFIPDFCKYIVVINNNLQTGFEVDTQRAQAVQAFMDNINA